MTQTLLHIVSSLEVGGAEKFVKNLSIEQHKQQNRVSVISFGLVNDPFQPMIEEKGISVVNLSGSFFSRSKQLIKEIANADVIHIHSPSVIRAILPIFPFFLSKKVVYTIHGEVDPQQSLLALSHQISRCYLNNIVAVSSSSKLSVESRYGWNPENIGVIKNGISLGSKKAHLSEKIKLGIVSRLIPLKNIPMLFEAIALLPIDTAKQFELDVFGDGIELESLKEKAKAIANSINVKFHGNIIDESAIYNTFDVLIMCSDTEGLPMSILEAMGYGIPVISTDVGAISQVVIDKETGWLYKVKDTKKLSDLLSALSNNPEVINVAGLKSKNMIKNHYSISQVYSDYQQVYSS